MIVVRARKTQGVRETMTWTDEGHQLNVMLGVDAVSPNLDRSRRGELELEKHRESKRPQCGQMQMLWL